MFVFKGFVEDNANCSNAGIGVVQPLRVAFAKAMSLWTKLG
jgi:hypothetical protein